MSGWRAIVPIRLGLDCKSRLAAVLTPCERQELVAAMARHVLAQLQSTDRVAAVQVLSPTEPPFPGVAWLQDHNRGLNAELAPSFERGRTLVIHADLPLLAGDEVAALIAAAEETGAALAADRAGSGTNALALVEARPFTPCFGADSMARHLALLPHALRVDLPGLALDIDTPEDLALARQASASSIAGPI